MRKRKDENIIVSQWQSCVEMLNAVNQRRDNVNDRFCAINTAVIAAISFVWDIRTIALIAVGLIICIIWIKLILNFREIKRERYKVIKSLEKKLPANVFSEEWNCLRNNRRYKEGTNIEVKLPLCFMILYLVLIYVIIILHFDIL